MRKTDLVWSLLLVFVAGVFACCKPNNGTQTEEPDEPQTPIVEANKMVIYECNERLFAEQDAFAAIEAYIPTLKEMGVNVLWLMPIHPRGEGDKSIGSPYCVRDFKGIDPAFGKMEDLQSLVSTAHQNGMKVILDWIGNHTSWDNAWVMAHPDWYTGPQTGDEQQWADVTFLNYSNPAVCDAMQDAMLYWVDEAGVDGFRCDYAHGVPVDFWTKVNAEIFKRKKDAIMLAETSDVRLCNAGFNLLYSWSYMYAIEGLYKGTGTFTSVLSASKSEYESTPEGCERMRYVTTHDETSQVAPATVFRNAQGELSAFCLTIFMGGVPMIYSSQDLGYMNTINFFHYNLLDFAAENTTRDALCELMNVYLNTATLRGGKQSTGSLNSKVPYLEYVAGDKTLLVICNTSKSEQQVKLPMKHQGKVGTDLLSKQPCTLGSVTTLSEYEYRIYELTN